MSMYWILFIGIAVISYIVQNSLQSKFKKYSKMPLASGCLLYTSPSPRD